MSLFSLLYCLFSFFRPSAYFVFILLIWFSFFGLILSLIFSVHFVSRSGISHPLIMAAAKRP